MIVFVPVSRHRVDYEVASGRPYSALERLVLDAVHGGATNLRSLHDIFRIPERLLIEALVTLTHAGWLAIGGKDDHGFLLTAEGQSALETGQDPKSSLTVEGRFVTVVMEHLTGALTLNRDIFLRTDKDIRSQSGWEKSLRLQASRTVLLRLQLDQSEVQHLLPRGKGEWIRSIGPITIADRNIYWAVLSVDLDDGTIVGVPDPWRSRIMPTILDEIQNQRQTIDAEVRKQVWVPPTRANERHELAPTPSAWPTKIDKNDFLTMRAEHGRYFASALANADSSIFVASAFLNVDTLLAYEQSLLNALKRGVDIDVLWGYQEGPGSTRWLDQLSRRAQRARLAGKIRFNRERSLSHAKLILWDHGGTFEACVGSYNWLSVNPNSSGNRLSDISVVLRHPGIVSSLCRCVAALWQTARSELLSSTSNRWSQIASDIEQVTAQAGSSQELGDNQDPPVDRDPNANVSLALDRDHEEVLARLLRSSERRLMVASHKIGLPGLRRLRLVTESTHGQSWNYSILVGEIGLQGEARDDLNALIAEAQGKMIEVTGLHSKAVVADDSAFVSSFNPLYGAPLENLPIVREIGILIEGIEPANHLWELSQAAANE